jgi:hypothetical protein
MIGNFKNKIEANDTSIKSLLKEQKFYIDYFQDPSLRDDARTKDLLTALVYWDNTYTNLKSKYSDRQVSCENAAKDLKESAEAVRSLLSEL